MVIVFSLDSIITASGLVNQVAIMIGAVTFDDRDVGRLGASRDLHC
jgi:hypothetical protein